MSTNSKNTQGQATAVHAGLQKLHAVDVSMLRTGVKLEYPIHNDRQLLLLGKGQIITVSFLERLKAIGVQRVIVHESELERLLVGGSPKETPSTAGGNATPGNAQQLLNAAKQNRVKLGMAMNGEPFAASVPALGAVDYSRENIQQMQRQHEESLEFVADTFQEMVSTGKTDVAGISEVSGGMLKNLVADPDLFAFMGIDADSNEYPIRHCKHVAMLASLIGVRLGLDETNMIHLTSGCLLHDAGMLLIDQQVYESPARLNSVQFLEITKHPTLIYDILQQNNDVNNTVKSIVYQMHERNDGSGYPRNLPGQKIHPLAKIAAVADVFVALISDRPHRPGMLPYQAMEKLLKDASRGKLDSQAVRALLESVSLFPIGSHVGLSDQRLAQVIRSNGENFNRPIVKAWHVQPMTGNSEVIDLTAQTEFKVVRPIAPDDERLQQIKTAASKAVDDDLADMADCWD